MTRFFKNVKTAEELRRQFVKLAKELHPDNGGDAEAFKAMMAEYNELYKECGSTFTTSEGKTYQKEETTTAEQFAEIVRNIIHWTDCKIEVCGSWLWVSGGTYNHREDLKKMHFGFSKNKKAWYFHEGSYHKKGRRSLSMDEIRQKFGTAPIDPEGRPSLT